MALLDVQDITAGYGDAEILHGVSLAVESEEIVCVIGPNGAGKSTCLKAIFGLADCWEGSISFQGEQVIDVSPDDMTQIGVSYVPQTENVFPSLTVRENLKLGAYIRDSDPEGLYQTIYEQFPILEERKDQKAGTMSGGQQQMLALGRALMIEPDLLLVDEPSAGLAPDIIDDVFEKINEINESGTAILMIEQNARKALRNADTGYVLDGGENHFEDDADSLLDNDEIVDMYLGEAVAN